jgi:FMN phosphatase YigB (HAD superfamily)
MTGVVILDVGDVLINTHPDAHYRALAGILGIPWRHVRLTIEHSGVVPEFELGHLSETQFADALRELLAAPHLPAAAVELAWCAVIGPIDNVIARPARSLSSAGRLMLASNTNPTHWRRIHSSVEQAGITAPALLSFEAGIAKPDPSFFTALTELIPRTVRCDLYIDDRAENVAAARAAGLPTARHTDPRATSARLADLAARPDA